MYLLITHLRNLYVQVFCDRMKFCGSGAEVSRAADEIPSTPENIFLENYYTGI